MKRLKALLRSGGDFILKASVGTDFPPTVFSLHVKRRMDIFGSGGLDSSVGALV